MTCAEKLSLMHSGPRHSLSHSLSTAYLSGKISMRADHSAAISCQSQYTVSENRKDSTSACDAGHTWLSAASIEEMYAVAKSPAQEDRAWDCSRPRCRHGRCLYSGVDMSVKKMCCAWSETQVPGVRLNLAPSAVSQSAIKLTVRR